MRSLTKKTVKALAEILSKGSVSQSKIDNDDLFGHLLRSHAVSFERLGKGRFRYVLKNEESLRLLCREYDTRLSNIEDYLGYLESDNDLAPSEQAKLFNGNDKYVKRQLWEGFFLKSNTEVEITYNTCRVTVSVTNPLLVEDRDRLVIPKGIAVVVVENYQMFHDLSWMSGLLPKRDYLVICRWPQSLAQRQFLATLSNDKYYFGDMDLAGIHIFLSEYSSCIPMENYIIPEDVLEQLGRGSSDLYAAQEHKFKDLCCSDSRINNLIKSINKVRKAYIQEMYLNDQKIK